MGREYVVVHETVGIEVPPKVSVHDIDVSKSPEIEIAHFLLVHKT